MQQAAEHYGRGEWRHAEQLCRAMLDLAPRDFHALHLLGVIAAQTQRPAEAAELLRLAVVIGPDDAAAQNNYGNVLRELGRPEAALACHERALHLRPDYAEAWNNRGNALRALGRLEEALDSYDAAIRLRADHALAHNNRAAILQELRHPEAALEGYERALRIRPDYAEAHSDRGNLLRQLRRFDAALESFANALRIQPDLATAHNGRGNTLLDLSRPAEALKCYEQALRIHPNDAATLSNRAAALESLQRFDEALESCARALALDPNCAQAYSNRANTLRLMQRLDAALDSVEHALRLKPDFVEAHLNRGCILYDRREPEAAAASFTEALRVSPCCARAYRNRAHARLLAGDLPDAWADNEWRWNAPDGADRERRDLARPLWLGQESLAGRTILLHAEQGFGDTLQFCRYVTLIAQLGARVVLEVPQPLVSLLASLAGVTQMVSRGDPLPAFDYHCPLLSLPLAFKTTLSTIPAQVPYLSVARDKVRYWQKRLADSRKLKVGLVWSGGFRANRPDLWGVNRRRNIPLARLALPRDPHIEFYSLQKGRAAQAELAELVSSQWHGPQLIDFTCQLQDFSDTAALVENLDLVISVDTATAHLAGALGKPVWIMNRFAACWRWLLERRDSPWYPTARLYRQPRPGDWDTVVEQLSADLAELAITRRVRPSPAGTLR